MNGAQACLKSSMIALLCRSDLAMENVVTKLENLNAVSVTRFFGGRGKVWHHSTSRGKVDVITIV